MIKVTVKEATPRGRVKKGEIYNALVVLYRQGYPSCDGSLIKFDGNADVLLNTKLESISTRILDRSRANCAPKVHEDRFGGA